jgi:hypothetical protein
MFFSIKYFPVLLLATRKNNQVKWWRSKARGKVRLKEKINKS